jgi:asparagine synthase (glutamine-hydrolysing)
MCGVAGFINFNQEPASPVLLKKMTDSIAHRGPDGEGQWIDGHVAIGHRRLSIIDLTPAGHQPMQTIDGRFILSYNGEVYNFKQLRTQLEAQDVQFRSETDSEVVLQALAKWGPDALLKFNGMFALALWDTKEETLLLARDRYGIKPMYFARQANRFWFASEHKAIVTDPTFARDLNLPALLEYMTFQNIFTDQTLLHDISLLPAGHYMTVSVRNRAIERHLYWDFHFEEPANPADTRDYEEELDRLFKQAVKRQLVSDVEIGAYLSGGMDSGSITAIAAQEIPNLKSFTVGFDLSSASGIELGFDERSKAEAMSAVFRTEHYEMVLKAGDMERCLPDLVWALEEPRVGQSYPNFYAAKLASRFVKVVLSGAGGDELFGGYPWRYYRSANSKSFEEFVDSYYLYWQRLASNSELKQLFSPVWAEVEHVWTRDIFRDVFESHSNELKSREDYVNHSLYFEAKTFLHGLLVVEDKLSMAHSLETRVPFLDNDLVDFAMRVPVALKVKNLEKISALDENDAVGKARRQIQRPNDGKHILRQTMSRYVPDGVSARQKQGFSSPDASWFRGESVEFVSQTIAAGLSESGHVFERCTVERLVEDHTSGRSNRRLLVWSLINFDFWRALWLPTLRNLSGRIKSEGGIQKNFLATEATKLEKNSRFSA